METKVIVPPPLYGGWRKHVRGIKAGGKPIYITDPDGEPEYDGDDPRENEEEAYRRAWEQSTYEW